MKKSLFNIVGIAALALVLSSCSTLSGIEKEKTEDGFIESHDLVYDTVKIQHPALVPDFGVGKFNLNGKKQFENIQAYIYNNDFYLEADYGSRGRETLNIDTVMFFTTRNKTAFKNAQEGLPDTYHRFTEADGYTYENLKITLAPEDITLLGRFLIADEVYISFAGERGRTDLFKLSNKLKKSMLAVINKWNKINNQPVIEAPKPEKKVEAAPVEETAEEADTEENEAEPEETKDETASGVIETTTEIETE